jgi:hypothetical protein
MGLQPFFAVPIDQNAADLVTDMESGRALPVSS